jgi:hypothetical protein
MSKRLSSTYVAHVCEPSPYCADWKTGRLSEVFGENYTVPQTLEAAHTRSVSPNRCREPDRGDSAPTQQPCTSTTAKRYLGVSHMLFLESRTLQFRSSVGLSNTYTAMSSLRNQAAHCACSKSSNSGHVEQTSTSTKRFKVWRRLAFVLGEWNGVMSKMHARESPLLEYLRDLWCSVDDSGRPTTRPSQRYQQTRFPWAVVSCNCTERRARMYQGFFPTRGREDIPRALEECLGAAQVAASQCSANTKASASFRSIRRQLLYQVGSVIGGAGTT